MTSKTNTFNGGTPGANFTVAGSGGESGDGLGFNIVNGSSAPSGSSLVQYANDWTAEGAVSLRMTLSAGTTYVAVQDSEAGTRFVARRPVYITAAPTATVVLGTIRDAAGIMSELRMNPSRQIFCTAGGSTIPSGVMSPAVALNTLYWVEWAALAETGGGSNGRVDIFITNGSGTTFFGPASSASTGVTRFGALPIQYRFGGATTASGWTTERLDAIRWGALSTGWHGVPSTPPTIVIDDFPGFAKVDLRDTTSGTGSAMTFSLVHVSGPDHSADIEEPTEGFFIVPQDPSEDSVYDVVVVDGGSTFTSEVTIPALPSGAIVSIERVVWDGTNWV